MAASNGPVLPRIKFRPEFYNVLGFVGMQGSGKTASAVNTGIEFAKEAGMPLYANMELHTDEVETRRVRGVNDLFDLEPGVLIWDDVASVAPSRGTMGVPPKAVARLAALRHYDVALIWTSITFGSLDIKVREITQSVVAMRAVRRERVPGQLLLNTRTSYGKQYRTESELVTDINSDTRYSHHGFVKLADLRLDAYNTREDLPYTADHTLCPECGLALRREYCKGHKHSLHSEEEA